MLWLALFLAVLVGFSLGLFGSGGSVLTLPILVYLLKVDVLLATSYSLFVVGVSALIGSFYYFRKGLSDVKIALIFGIPSVVSVYLTRVLLLPEIPDVMLFIGDWTLTKSLFLMLLFSFLMFVSALSMIRSGENKVSTSDAFLRSNQRKYTFVFFEGAFVGVLTGLVGAGGGFLIVPALVLISGIPMKRAVGTSLLIIASKSLFGFFGDLQRDVPIDFVFLAQITSSTVLGIIIGSVISEKWESEKLKRGFGWFVMAVALVILVSEVFI